MNLAELEKGNEQEDVNAFYISFSDLMVLLSTFFLMILSMSSIEIGSFEKMKTGMTGSTKGTLVELADRLKVIAEKDPGVPGVKVNMAPDGVRLDLDTAALFDTASAVLKPNALEPIKPLLDEILKTNYTIDIEGHSDDRRMYRKVGKEIETNWSLSGRRSSSVTHHLLEFGFKSSRLRIVGYAANKPKVTLKGKTGKDLDEARAENRRVSLLVK